MARALHAIAAAACGIALTMPALGAPEVKRIDGVPVVSGGIGTDERAQMASVLPDHNLKVMTAVRGSGEYVAGATLDIRDARGASVLQTTLDGPWLFTRLAPGRYELRASYGGGTQTRTVTIADKGSRTEAFYWNDPSVTTMPR